MAEEETTKKKRVKSLANTLSSHQFSGRKKAVDDEEDEYKLFVSFSFSKGDPIIERLDKLAASKRMSVNMFCKQLVMETANNN